MSRIAIIGAGAWGTALSIVLGGHRGHEAPHEVRLWAHEKEVCDSISSRRINEPFLPGHAIPLTVVPTTTLETALASAEVVVSVMPSQHCRGLFRKIKPLLGSGTLVVSATKGLEEDSLLRMSEVIAQELGNDALARIGAISGPSFAHEVARGDPTAVTIASLDNQLAATVQREFSGPTFRVYTNDDIVGVELGGALKNTIAIAAGVCDGLGLGHNSAAALITRGLAEITRLTLACGGRASTMAGLAGLGDLVLTCTGGLSRNRSVGVGLGKGKTLAEILAAMHGTVAEGVFTTAAAVGLARVRGVEMPIAEQMYAILHDGKSPRDAIYELMSRTSKSESAQL
jgi:glycerol-3-phosphate dehydrogenase (NAD(P)+)